jgi:hypothetical protein
VSPDFTPDPIFAMLEGQPDVVVLIGYMDDDRGDHVRMFQDPELRVWMDIPRTAVVERHRIPAEVDLLGGRTMLWVNADVMRAPIDSGLQQSFAEAFLIGEFAAEVLVPATLEEAAYRLTFMEYRPTYKRCP